MDPSAVGRTGCTHLILAAHKGRADIVQLLLQAGAALEAADSRGRTALHVAAWAGHEPAVKVLCEHGANREARCAAGTTPHQLAHAMGNFAAAQRLSADSTDAALVAEDTLTGVSDKYVSQALAMEMPVRRLLAHNAPPSSVPAGAVVHSLHFAEDQFREAVASLSLSEDNALLRRQSILDHGSCAALRAAVDKAAGSSPDSVDGLAEHQLDFRDLDALTSLIGHEAATRLKQLPTEFARLKPRAKGLGGRASALRVSSVFVRRYTADTRPWFMFHHDVPPLTANVALAGAPRAPDSRLSHAHSVYAKLEHYPTQGDCCHEGGRLLGLFANAVQLVEREEGEVTVHAKGLLHGVTRMRSGVRYSLIIFYREREGVRSFVDGFLSEWRRG